MTSTTESCLSELEVLESELRLVEVEDPDSVIFFLARALQTLISGVKSVADINARQKLINAANETLQKFETDGRPTESEKIIINGLRTEFIGVEDSLTKRNRTNQQPEVHSTLKNCGPTISQGAESTDHSTAHHIRQQVHWVQCGTRWIPVIG